MNIASSVRYLKKSRSNTEQRLAMLQKVSSEYKTLMMFTKKDHNFKCFTFLTTNNYFWQRLYDLMEN